MQLVSLVGLAIAVWAFIDCLLRPARAFPAVDRQTKVAWLIFLGLALVIQYFMGTMTLFGIASIILAVYYLVDVRAKVAAAVRR